MERKDHFFFEVVNSSFTAHCVGFYSEICFLVCDVSCCFSSGRIYSRADKYFIEAGTSHGEVKNLLIIIRVRSTNCLKGSGVNFEHFNIIGDSQIFCMIIITGN